MEPMATPVKTREPADLPLAAFRASIAGLELSKSSRGGAVDWSQRRWVGAGASDLLQISVARVVGSQRQARLPTFSSSTQVAHVPRVSL